MLGRSAVCVMQARSLEGLELVDRRVHVLGVEQPDVVEQFEVLNRQPRDPFEQRRVERLDDVLQGLLTEVGCIHEHGNLGEELLQLLANLLALLGGRVLRPLLPGVELAPLLSLRLFQQFGGGHHLLGVVHECAEVLDLLQRRHEPWVVEHP